MLKVEESRLTRLLSTERIERPESRIRTSHLAIARTGWRNLCQSRIGNENRDGRKALLLGAWRLVEKSKAKLRIKAIGGEVSGEDRIYKFREGDAYNDNFAAENTGLRPKNTYPWNISA